ncbi:TFIIB-type zinc ribbon-containing protein [Amycolatopsis sp. cg5]|uniref:TFIIB-type zinc ribbon-containing protein n=1 Tax=Amycolatopsis sp. cg5 TaxID=3238802 RepID=UPI0035235DD8
MTRFTDPKVRLDAMAEYDIAVVCQRCSARAVVTKFGDHRRLVCTGCAHAEDRVVRRSCWGGPIDPYFWRPLWFQADFRGHTLWAFNRTHLSLIEDYVAASIRERGAGPSMMSMVNKLPLWIKTAKNREAVLHTIARMKRS